MAEFRLGALFASLLLGAASVGFADTPPSADQLLAQRVSAALNADPTYFFRHVTVQANAGVITLSGYVWSQPAITRARQIAGKTPGVTQVVASGLELERNGRNVAPAR